MLTIKTLAREILKIDGDDLDSNYLRAAYVYPFSIAILFPPPFVGIGTLKASTIVWRAKTTAAARLFDYRTFNLDSAWNDTEYELRGLKLPRKTLHTRALFADRVARSLFCRHLFHPKRGISRLLETSTFDITENMFDNRRDEMEILADLVNIYMLCAPEIKKRSKYNGLNIALSLYLDYITTYDNYDELITEEAPDQTTIAKNWERLKPAAIFHYLHKCQNQLHPVFSPPSVNSENFAQEMVSLSEPGSLLKLMQYYDYVSNILNDMFELEMPVIGLPAASFELQGNAVQRDKFLALLK